MSNFNMSAPVTKRIGRKLTVYTKHCLLKGKRATNHNLAPQAIYEPYELTIYNNCISIRQHTDEFGSYITWIPLDEIISLSEVQVEGQALPKQLLLQKNDGLGNVLQD